MLIFGEPVNKETGTSPNLASEATVGVGISPGIGCASTLIDSNRKVIVAVACRYAVVFMWEGCTQLLGNSIAFERLVGVSSH